MWFGGVGRCCRVWGLVMGFLLAAAGGGTRGAVCRQGYRHQSAGGGCRVSRLWPGLGGGRGGVVWGRHCWCWGGWGWVLRWLGVWATLWAVWVLHVRAVRSLRSLAACGVELWMAGGRMGVQVGLRSVGTGWLPVHGAPWYALWIGGLLLVVGCFY